MDKAQLVLEVLLKGEKARKDAANLAKQIMGDFRKQAGVGISSTVGGMSNRELESYLTKKVPSVLGSVDRQMKGFANKQAAVGKTFGQKFKQGFENAFGQGGFGQYLIAGGLGGRLGIGGLAMGDMAKNLLSPFFKKGSIAPTGVKLGIAGVGIGAGILGNIASAGADLVGLNKQTFDAYAEFDKNIRLAALNLKATATGAFDMKDAMDDFSMTAKALATEFGSVGNAGDIALLLKRASGLGGLSKEEVKRLTETSLGLSMVSENTTPDQAMKAIGGAFMAYKQAGINIDMMDIASAYNMAGILSPTDVGDFAKNAGKYSAFIAAGGSLSEGLGMGALLGQTGWTGPQAATQLASMKQRLPGVISRKGLGKILLGDIPGANEKLANMDLLQVTAAFIRKAKQEGFNMETGQIGEGVTAKNKINELNTLYSEIFGLRGGGLMNALKQASEMNPEALTELFKQIENTGKNKTVLQGMIDTMKDTPGNRVAGAFNALQNLQTEVMGVVAPFLGLAAQKFTIEGERARLSGMPDSVYKDKALKDLEAREAKIGSAEELYSKYSQQYANTIYAPFVDIGKKIYDFISSIDATEITGMFKMLGESINMVVGVMGAFAELLINLVGWFGPESAKQKKYIYETLTEQGVSKQKAMGAFNLSDEEAKDKAAMIDFMKGKFVPSSLVYMGNKYQDAKNPTAIATDWANFLNKINDTSGKNKESVDRQTSVLGGKLDNLAGVIQSKDFGGNGGWWNPLGGSSSPSSPVSKSPYGSSNAYGQ